MMKGERALLYKGEIRKDYYADIFSKRRILREIKARYSYKKEKLLEITRCAINIARLKRILRRIYIDISDP